MSRKKLNSRDDYILRISAGPDFESLRLVDPNDEENPLFVDSAHFCGYLMLRYLDFNGVTSGMEAGGQKDGTKHRPISHPKSTYFSGRKRRYSIVVQGRFKETYSGNDILFGVDSDQELPNIPGFGMLVRISKWLDPSLEAGNSDHPHCFTPLISAMNSLAVYPVSPKRDFVFVGRSLIKESENNTTPSQSSDSLSIPSHIDKMTISIGESDFDCGDWAFATTDVPENSDVIFASRDDAEYATTYEKRKRLFGRAEKRNEVTLSSDYIYCMDFYGMCDEYFWHNTSHCKSRRILLS